MARPEPAPAPPARDGIQPSRVVVAAGQGNSLLDFLTRRMPAADWAGRLAAGLVLDAGGQPWPLDAPAQPGALVWYWRSPPPEVPVPFEIELLHQCEHLVVVDKPHFLASVPAGRHLQETALVRLQRQLGLPNLAPLHRLDLETAGVLAFCVQPAERAGYHALLRQRQVHKVYEAVAPWRDELALPLLARHRLDEPAGRGFMQMQVVPGEPNAETRIELIRRLPGPPGAPALALYRLTPRTGRRHQLRAQLNALGLPIVGDRIYPRLWPEALPGAAPDVSQPLQLLARELAFTDPHTGQARRFTSRRVLDRAGGVAGAPGAPEAP